MGGDAVRDPQLVAGVEIDLAVEVHGRLEAHEGTGGRVGQDMGSSRCAVARPKRKLAGRGQRLKDQVVAKDDELAGNVVARQNLLCSGNLAVCCIEDRLARRIGRRDEALIADPGKDAVVAGAGGR